jgi:hypothetical protein
MTTPSWAAFRFDLHTEGLPMDERINERRVAEDLAESEVDPFLADVDAPEIPYRNVRCETLERRRRTVERAGVPRYGEIIGGERMRDDGAPARATDFRDDRLFGGLLREEQHTAATHRRPVTRYKSDVRR